MSRKLFLLNLLLIALVGGAAWHLRQSWQEAGTRQRGFLERAVPAAAAPATPKIDPVAPASAASYTEVATKMLFSRDRNPNVIVEEPKPKPVPQFPVAYGVLLFGDTATAFLSEAPGKPQKSYRTGEKVGPFKLAAMTQKELVLEWEDKTFTKTVEELKPKADAAPAPQPGSKSTELPKNTSAVTPSEKILEIQKSMTKDVGIDVGGTDRVCVPGDTAPPGTVTNGFRKVVTQTPFGQSCRWVPVR